VSEATQITAHERRVRIAILCFLTVALLSLLNVVVQDLTQGWSSFLALGFVHVLDVVHEVLPWEAAEPVEEVRFLRLTLAMKVLASFVFFVVGWLARRNRPKLFLIGVVLYFFDCLLLPILGLWLTPTQMLLIVSSHMVVLVLLIRGALSYRALVSFQRPENCEAQVK
jgi:hypothetical protein